MIDSPCAITLVHRIAIVVRNLGHFCKFDRSETHFCALVEPWKQTRNCHPNVRAR